MPKAFVKLGKFKHIGKHIDNGDLRFAPAYEFSHMQEGKDIIADKYDGLAISNTHTNTTSVLTTSITRSRMLFIF